MKCGHAQAEVASGREGTNYCMACEAEARASEMRTPAQVRSDEWNARYPIGTEVLLVDDYGDTTRTETRGTAYVLGEHTAVIAVEGRKGCYMLSRIRPLETTIDRWSPPEEEVLYGLEDCEESFDDLEICLDQIVRALDPDDDLPDDVKIIVYRRMQIERRGIAAFAEGVIDSWIGWFCDQYGSPEGDASEQCGDPDILELMHTFERWAKRAVPFRCEPTGEVIVVDSVYFNERGPAQT